MKEKQFVWRGLFVNVQDADDGYVRAVLATPNLKHSISVSIDNWHQHMPPSRIAHYLISAGRRIFAQIEKWGPEGNVPPGWTPSSRAKHLFRDLRCVGD